MGAPAIKRPYVIATVGTSLTSGRLATSWDTDLQNALTQVVDREVRVLSLGKGSQTSTSWLIPTQANVAAHKADMILFEGFAINDCAMGISQAEHIANINAFVAYQRANSARSRLCIQTMSSVVSTDTNRTNLGAYYADEIARAAALGIDSLNHYLNWPKPLDPYLTQIDPTTGQPDGLHPTKAAVRQYTFPTIVNYIAPIILAS
jgi:lysophospholipase L1-like esterase